jgi:hypothetical protein
MFIVDDIAIACTNFVFNLYDEFKDTSARGKDPHLIERLCHGLGWTVDEYHGNIRWLHFTDLKGCRRTLNISHNPDCSFVLLGVTSSARPAARYLPPEILPWLHRRNHQMPTGAWEIHLSADDRVFFFYTQAVPTKGLTPKAFQAHCQSMLREAAEFDSDLEQAGLLRCPDVLRPTDEPHQYPR